MKYIKKVAVTPVTPNTGDIIDSFNTQDDKHTNAPSINAVEDYVENYSTTEKRIGTWIGKPLYRKIITVPALPNNSDMYVKYDETYTVVKLDVYIEDPSAGFKFKLPLVSSNTNTVIGCYIMTQTHQIGIRTFNDKTSFTNNYAIIEYTKTTD